MSETIEKLAKTIKGSKKNRDITLLTLSTCMWCKKCKSWLQDRDIQYKYVDVDKIKPGEKLQIIEYLKYKYQSRVSYPFMICDNEFVVGYNPDKYEELIKSGGK
ncbi:MAG: glutaredoxin family protein [Candidatus Odinarchaeota archaeon]